MVGAGAPAAANDGYYFFRNTPRIIEPERAERFLAPHAKRKGKPADAELKKSAEKIPQGPLQVLISIRHQRLTLLANGEVIAHSAVSTGVPGHPTPQGVFSIIQKNRHHRSNIYSDAPMPYMQRITWSGIALHQGVVPGRPASHGCIRLPGAFAARLWGLTRIGARVIISQDDVSVAQIDHNGLLALQGKLPPAAMNAPAFDPQQWKVRVATSATATDAVPQAVAPESQFPAPEFLDDDNGRIANESVRAAVRAETATESTGSIAAVDETVKPPLDKIGVAESARANLLKPGPISIYVSRKLGRLFVRKGFEPVFESPVTIAQADVPFGTHVFTALETKDDTVLRWNVVSLPTEITQKIPKRLGGGVTREVIPPARATDVLDRVTIPDDAKARIAELLTVGASLIISDHGISHETGKGTDFIVLTR